VTLQGRAAKFVCEKHDMAAMHARFSVIIDAWPLTPRQLKAERAQAKKALAVAAFSSKSGSHLADHVAGSAIDDDAGLCWAAAQLRARDANSAIVAARDASEAPAQRAHNCGQTHVCFCLF